MCLTCGCMSPDKSYGENRLLTLQDILDAAQADDATVEQAWKNMVETMSRVMNGEVKSAVWKPARRIRNRRFLRLVEARKGNLRTPLPFNCN